MRHISDGVLRRLDDEPLAVPDRISEHVAGCERCSARRAEIAHTTERSAQLLAVSQHTPDIDVAWARLARELELTPKDGPRARPRAVPGLSRRVGIPRLSLRAGLAIGAGAIVIAGTAAAATWTTIFAPTHVAPVSVSQSDLRAIAAFIGFGDAGSPGGFGTPNGSSTLRFGSITWSSGSPQPVSSVAQASARVGFAVHLPTHRPAGVGAVQQLIVQPRLKATIVFNSKAASLAGHSVTIDAGPGVIAGYGAANATGVPTLAVATVRRPMAQSTGTSLSKIEAFLLGQRGVPAQLVEEVRLLGDLRTTLPVPVPSRASVRSVQIAGWPGVLLSDSSNAAAAAVWEDGQGLLHIVVGILDSRDVLNVANQLG